MHSRLISADEAFRTFCLVLEPGEEFIAELEAFAAERGFTGSRFHAIGAFQDATIAWFNLETREYERIPVQEQVEVASLIGNVGLGPDGEVIVHAHVVLGRRDGSTLAGHLIEGHVQPTLEVMLTEHTDTLQRATDAATDLPLLLP